MALERPQRQHRVGTREDDVREVAVLLPGPEEERLVAEQEVVGTARLGEEALGLGAGGLALVRLPVEQLRRPVRGPAHLQDDEQHGERDGRRREAPGAAEDPGATRMAKKGSTKIRWRDSGDVEPPKRAARKAATGTPTTQRASARLSPRTRMRPIRASSSTTTSTGQRPLLKSPAVCHRYVTIAHGPPSFAPRPPTPTSNRPARTRSVSQKGCPRQPRPQRRRRPGACGHGGRRRRTRACAARTRAPYGMCGDGEQDRSGPERPGPPAAAVEGAQEQHEREQGEEEEEAVHPRVDPVEEEDPAAGDECGRDQRRRRSASRRPSSATRGRLATANAAETRRRLPRPSPRWATA